VEARRTKSASSRANEALMQRSGVVRHLGELHRAGLTVHFLSPCSSPRSAPLPSDLLLSSSLPLPDDEIHTPVGSTGLGHEPQSWTEHGPRYSPIGVPVSEGYIGQNVDRSGEGKRRPRPDPRLAVPLEDMEAVVRAVMVLWPSKDLSMPLLDVEAAKSSVHLLTHR
jgi:hypothetical protein